MPSSISQGNTTEEGWSYSDALGWLLARSSAGTLTTPPIVVPDFSVAPDECRYNILK
jgi:hypothetical protein